MNPRRFTVEPNVPTTPERREQLARALKPQTEAEHQLVDYLAAVVREQHPTFVGMVERRVRTARRAGVMATAQRTLGLWEPSASAGPTEVTEMEHLASGGDPFADQPGELAQLDRDQEVGDERRGETDG
jgi:hypothetical protein